MRPWLPSIGSSGPITGASASDRGWVREGFPDLRSHFLFKLLARYRRSQLGVAGVAKAAASPVAACAADSRKSPSRDRAGESPCTCRRSS